MHVSHLILLNHRRVNNTIAVYLKIANQQFKQFKTPIAVYNARQRLLEQDPRKCDNPRSTVGWYESHNNCIPYLHICIRLIVAFESLTYCYSLTIKVSIHTQA